MNIKKNKGFTLIEVMIVVAIIAILAAIAIPNIIAYRQNANRAKCIGNLKQIQNAVEGYRSVHPTASSVELKNSVLVGPSLWLKEMPTCPAGGTYKSSFDLTSTATDAAIPTCTKSTDSDYPHTL